MVVWIDADACPVVNITVTLCREVCIPCKIVTDTAHQIHWVGAETVIADKGADSVDFLIANRIHKGDIIITRDYGVAAMCLGRDAIALHQDGWVYHRDNIDALLFSRHASRKHRASGGRTKGPKKRTKQQDAEFETALRKLLQQEIQGSSKGGS